MDIMLVRGPPMRESVTCSVERVRPKLVGSPSMIRTPSWRLLTGVGESNGEGSKDLQLLLLQPLHYHG